ncbi:N-alpha-acetyltransferase 80 [Neodiprion lecontei]|uniref:N-acetyltransferase 6 n=1 Tax=Neodiprion lecontei TaxID=441921 RepID=A0A6J0BM54_NEOLC|nr:N-alpha-acetyltransferase 80 [Neodiprion lecontei]XP_015515675.1 N-alpha-acetyltransferase 80 [Neodiprion lecontei]XP_046484585.1 N-alpha-acetyltransferase 80-like [Neodiprion pinetum]XP_046484586.1 N-alpha-acetyltransferase 80-like [Neodiprion pinetum]XP_046597480.1 N-alpha-acetyltransferase 80 [Neodiprion lecontei]
MKDTPYSVVPLHKRMDLTRQCAKLVNSEWPRSETARLRSLYSSCDKFPTCLVLLDDTNVVGHCKISLVPNMCDCCFLESVVIDQKCRGRGLGSLLMRRSEEYVSKRGITKVLLSTKGQEEFYKKLGYRICDPLNLHENSYREKDSAHSTPQKQSNTTTSIGPPPPPMPSILRNTSLLFSAGKTYMMKNL